MATPGFDDVAAPRSGSAGSEPDAEPESELASLPPAESMQSRSRTPHRRPASASDEYAVHNRTLSAPNLRGSKSQLDAADGGSMRPHGTPPVYRVGGLCRSVTAASRESLQLYDHGGGLAAPCRPRTLGDIERHNDALRKENFKLKLMLDDYMKRGRRRHSGGPHVDVKVVVGDYERKLREARDQCESLEEKLDYEVHRYKRELEEKEAEMHVLRRHLDTAQTQMHLDAEALRTAQRALASRDVELAESHRVVAQLAALAPPPPAAAAAVALGDEEADAATEPLSPRQCDASQSHQAQLAVALHAAADDTAAAKSVRFEHGTLAEEAAAGEQSGYTGAGANVSRVEFGTSAAAALGHSMPFDASLADIDIANMTSATDLYNRTMNTGHSLNKLKLRLYTLRKLVEQLYSKLKGSGEFLKELLVQLGYEPAEGFDWQSFHIDLENSMRIARLAAHDCHAQESELSDLATDLLMVSRRASSLYVASGGRLSLLEQSGRKSTATLARSAVAEPADGTLDEERHAAEADGGQSDAAETERELRSLLDVAEQRAATAHDELALGRQQVDALAEALRNARSERDEARAAAVDKCDAGANTSLTADQLDNMQLASEHLSSVLLTLHELLATAGGDDPAPVAPDAKERIVRAVRQLADEAEAARRDFAQLQDYSRTLSIKTNELSDEVDRRAGESSALRDELRSATEQVDAAGGQLEEREAQLAEKQAELREMERWMEETEEQLRSLASEFVDFGNVTDRSHIDAGEYIAALQSHMLDRAAEVDELRLSLNTANQMADKLRRDNKRVLNELAAARCRPDVQHCGTATDVSMESLWQMERELVQQRERALRVRNTLATMQSEARAGRAAQGSAPATDAHALPNDEADVSAGALAESVRLDYRHLTEHGVCELKEIREHLAANNERFEHMLDTVEGGKAAATRRVADLTDENARLNAELSEAQQSAMVKMVELRRAIDELVCDKLQLQQSLAAAERSAAAKDHPLHSTPKRAGGAAAAAGDRSSSVDKGGSSTLAVRTADSGGQFDGSECGAPKPADHSDLPEADQRDENGGRVSLSTTADMEEHRKAMHVMDEQLAALAVKANTLVQCMKDIFAESALAADAPERLVAAARLIRYEVHTCISLCHSARHSGAEVCEQVAALRRAAAQADGTVAALQRRVDQLHAQLKQATDGSDADGAGGRPSANARDAILREMNKINAALAHTRKQANKIKGNKGGGR